MRPDCIEVTPPTFDDDLGLTQRVEDFAIEQFIAQACVEALDVAVFPGTAWLDIGRLCADRCDPFPYNLGQNSGPLSDRMWPGMPRRMKRSDNTSITSMALSFAELRIARHSWVNSSITLSIRYFRPSWVRSSTKS